MRAARPAAALSVVIPTHDRPVMIAEAVASALAALPEDAEVVVVDDRSRIPAAEVLAEVRAADVRLRVVPSDGPPGASGARNSGVEAARGDIVLFLDDDDWLLPGYPARVLAAARQPGRPVFGFCATETASGRDGPAGSRSAIRSRTGGLLAAATPLRRRISGFGTGFWIGRDLFREIGGCDPRQRVDEDTDFCCRLAARGLLPWYDPVPGIRLRASEVRTERLTRSTPAEEIVACYRRTWQRHEDSFPRWSESRWFLAARVVRRAVREGRAADAGDFVATVGPPAFRAALRLYHLAKRLRHGGRPPQG